MFIYLIKSKDIGVPFSIFFVNSLPIISDRNLGCIPKPGRILLTFFLVIFSPDFTSLVTNKDLEKAHNRAKNKKDKAEAEEAKAKAEAKAEAETETKDEVEVN